MFQAIPYNPVDHGDLESYLIDRSDASVDNLFFGPEFYATMMDADLLVPFLSSVRIAAHPIPDTAYIVGADYPLFSPGGGTYNMSCMLAGKGEYDPLVVLREKLWSISMIQLSHGHFII